MKGHWRAYMSQLIPSRNADQSTTETGIAESETQSNAALCSASAFWKIADNFQGKIEMDLNDQQLERYGWNDLFAEHFRKFAGQGYMAGRVALEYNQFCRVYTAQGEIWPKSPDG